MTRTHRAIFSLVSGGYSPVSRLIRLVQIVHTVNTEMPNNPPIVLALEENNKDHEKHQESYAFGKKVILFGTEESLLVLSARNPEFMQNAYFVEASLELPSNMSLVRRVRPRRNKDGVFANSQGCRWLSFPSKQTRQQMVLCLENVQADIATTTATSYGTCKNLES